MCIQRGQQDAARWRKAGDMYWFAVGLLILGAACGATIRLMTFVVVLLVAAVVAAASTFHHGAATALLNALLTVVTLQVGYVGGLVLRAGIASLLRRRPTARSRSVLAALRERRR